MILVSTALVFIVPSLAQTVIAASNTGVQVYINPPLTPAQPIGTTLAVQVKVANMPQFNTYDILVTSDTNVLNATSLSTTGNILRANTTGGTPIELVRCVNGVGPGCTPGKGDGPGVVHSAFTVLGKNVNASGNGLLFTINYSVIGGPTSPLMMQNATNIIAISGHKISHSTVSGRYATGPDFTLAALPESLTVKLGSSNKTTITLDSLNFGGTVNLATAYSEPLVTGTFSKNQAVLQSNGSNTTTLTVAASQQASATSFYVTVIARSSSFSRSFIIPITVNTTPDFQPGALPDDLLTHQSSANSTVVVVTSINGFTGNVTLRVDAPESTTATFDQYNNSTANVDVPPFGSANSTLRITTQASPTPFRDYFNITVTGGSITHTLVIVAEPPSPDFEVLATPTFASIQAGNSQTVSLNVTSLDYYWGSVYELGTTISGVNLAFDHGNFTLSWGQSQSSKLRITTDTSTPPGNYTITVVVFGIGQLNGASTRHTTQFTLRVSTLSIAPVAHVKTFLGLDETKFFGIVISLVVVLAVLGALESRRSKRFRRRSILEDEPGS